jgi:hypothetical protein
VAQDAERVAAVALEREHRVDHVLDHLGAGDLAFLGDVPDQQQRRARLLGMADQGAGRRADLADRAGGGIEVVRPERLDRIDHHQVGLARLAEGGEDVGEVGLAGEQHGGLRQPQALGAQADLGGGLLAREVERRAAAGRQRGAELEQQRRFADAGLAADQQRRAAHDAAPGHPVELGDARHHARRRLAALVERLEGDGAPARSLGQPRAGRRARIRFLGQRVPFAARRTFAHPALGDGAAVLAHEGGARAFGHQPRPSA